MHQCESASDNIKWSDDVICHRSIVTWKGFLSPNVDCFHFEHCNFVIWSFWRNITLSDILFLNLKMVAGVLYMLRPPLMEKDKEEDRIHWCSRFDKRRVKRLSQRVYVCVSRWIIDALFKQLFRDVIELESLSWENSARCQLTLTLILICLFHCSQTRSTWDSF